MKIYTGIASTTHIDKHGDRFSKGALDDMARQINEKYIPKLIDHDWDKHIGAILYGEVFQLNDGEYALGTVSGVFESEAEFGKFKTKSKNTVWQDYEKYLDVNELMIAIDSKSVETKEVQENFNKQRPTRNVADLLETHLDSTKVLPDGTVYKIKRFIASTGDLKIEVYPKDHYPTHFHVVSKQRKLNARFNLNTLEFLSMKNGKISNGDIRKIQNFFRDHPEMLIRLKEEYFRLK